MVEWLLSHFPHLVKKLRIESVQNAMQVADSLVNEVWNRCANAHAHAHALLMANSLVNEV